MNTLCHRVLIIGLDGAGASVRDADTPSIDSVFSEGVVTYSAKTAYPSNSSQCWGALFHGVGPEKHLLNFDSSDGVNPFPEDSLYPSFMKLARQTWPDCLLSSFSGWEPINSKMIEQSCRCHLVSLPDKELAPAIVDFIRNTPDSKILFIQFDDIDHAGHEYGYQSSEFYQQISKTDTYIGMIFDAMRESQVFDDTLILVTADHGGGGERKYEHGSAHPLDTTIFWGCRGPGIVYRGGMNTHVHIMDTAAVVAHALGLSAPISWDAKIPEKLFIY